MSLDWYDRFFLGGVFSMAASIGGYAGSVGLTETFSVAAFAVYGVSTAVGAAVGMDYFYKKFAPAEPEPPKEEKNPWVRKEEKVLTEAEQQEIFQRFMKKTAVLVSGFLLGSAGGFLAGYLLANAADRINSPRAADNAVVREIPAGGAWQAPPQINP